MEVPLYSTIAALFHGKSIYQWMMTGGTPRIPQTGEKDSSEWTDALGRVFLAVFVAEWGIYIYICMYTCVHTHMYIKIYTVYIYTLYIQYDHALEQPKHIHQTNVLRK